MVKCEVLEKAYIVVEKGSIVVVTQPQFDLAKNLLKPIEEEKKQQKKNAK